MSYGQFCGLARALDVVGDRWTLLIVRELLTGATRYGEIRAGLPGIATNLLADRLRRLEDDGIVETDEGRRYHLTERGAALRCVIDELIRWSEPLMARGRGDDEFSARWLVPALAALLGPEGDGCVEVDVEGASLHVVAADGSASVQLGRAPGAGARIESDGETLLAIAAGHVPLRRAVRDRVVRVTGDTALAARVLRPRSS